MNFYFVPTFQHICGVRVAELLWNHHIFDLKNIEHYLDCKNYFSLKEKPFDYIPCSVYFDLYALNQYSNHMSVWKFRQLLEVYTRNFGYQFLFFKLYEYHKWKLVLPIPKTIYWTIRGTLDRKKIAASLVKDVNLDILLRYKVACIYCLENDVIVLWNSMDVNSKKKIHEELCEVGCSKMYEIAFWTFYVCGIIHALTISHVKIRSENGIVFCPYRNGFFWALRDDNMIAAEYFFNKINHKEQKRILLTCNSDLDVAFARFVVDDIFIFPVEAVILYNASFAEILIFLLSKMDESQLSNCLGNKPWQILKCFLTWPWQPLFTKLVNQISNLFKVCDRHDYESLLYDVFLKSSEEWFDVLPFEEFWKSFPIDLKLSILKNGFSDRDYRPDGRNNCTIAKILRSAKRTREYTRAIFKHVSMNEKLTFINRHVGMNFWLDLIEDALFDAIISLIYECIPRLREFLGFMSSISQALMFKRPNFNVKEAKLFYSFLRMVSHQYEANRNQYLAS